MKGKSKFYLLKNLTQKDYDNLTSLLKHEKLYEVVRYVSATVGCSTPTAKWLCLKVLKNIK